MATQTQVWPHSARPLIRRRAGLARGEQMYNLRELIDRVEARLAGVDDPVERITTYLAGIEDETRSLSRLCVEDMTGLAAATNQIYRLTVRILGRRVGELISEGVRAGCIRPIHALFLGESVRLLVEATLDGRLPSRTGLTVAEAISELNSCVLRVLQQPSSGTRLMIAAS